MDFSELNSAYDLLKEKYNRHEQILIQAYKSLKEKEAKLKKLYIELCSKENELRAANEELHSTNEQLAERNAELMGAMQRLEETQYSLIQADKMASLGVLTAGIAHEINNPLNFIMGGYVGLDNYFHETGKCTDEIPILLDSIKTGVERATNIVKGLNQFSRNNEILSEDCDIHSILNNCLLMLDNQLKNIIKVEKNFTNQELMASGNVGKLHQVFINILSNSIQSIEKNGSITIRTHKKDKTILIEITDTGCGISKENLKKITEPFFTTKDPGKGTGLGLSIAYNIIQDHKGNIDIRSELNKGTKVKISLPGL